MVKSRGGGSWGPHQEAESAGNAGGGQRGSCRKSKSGKILVGDRKDSENHPIPAQGECWGSPVEGASVDKGMKIGWTCILF